MIRLTSRALAIIRENLFLNLVTFITIVLSVLIFSAFALFFINTDAIFDSWLKDMRIMAYLEEGAASDEIDKIKKHLQNIPAVAAVHFVSKDAALARFKKQLGPQASLLERLEKNPLPASFEISVVDVARNWRQIAPMVEEIEEIKGIDDVVYGRQWMGRFMGILDLFRLTGYGLAGLFFLGGVFFIANTTRMLLYARKDEIEIMRLVGATESFIKDPFYVQSLLLGGVGAGAGLGVLWGMFQALIRKIEAGSLILNFHVQFLPPEVMATIIFGSMFVGWTGCYISLRQFSK